MFLPAKIAKVVALQCGCLAEYPILGEFSELKEWHVLHTCLEHHGRIRTIEIVAEELFNSSITKYRDKPQLVPSLPR